MPATGGWLKPDIGAEMTDCTKVGLLLNLEGDNESITRQSYNSIYLVHLEATQN